MLQYALYLTCILQDRYPLQVMETGYDILFFWVARMAMLSNHFAKRPPFENIFLHAMVMSTMRDLTDYGYPTDKEEMTDLGPRCSRSQNVKVTWQRD